VSFDPAQLEKQPAAEPRGQWSARESEPKVDKTLRITDGDTQMRFQFNHLVHEAEIKFPEKPSDEVRTFLKDHSWKCDEDVLTGEKVWHKPVHFETRVPGRVTANREFWQASDMVREEKGLPPRSQGVEIPD
jgi:hypothetical protein